MDLELQGKVVAVTGAAGGIGRAITQMFSDLGATIHATDRCVDGLAAVAALPGVNTNVVELTDRTAAAGWIAAVERQAGQGIDILVNNAGITRDTLLLRMSVDQWDSVLDANLKGAFLCSREASKIMLRQKSGRIVNIASVNGLRGSAGQTNYSASKAGLIGFSRSLAKELASRGITVNVVAPGFIDTQMTDAFEGDAREQLLKMIPLGRFGQSEDVGAAVAFLASNAASYITGQVLTVDGGVTV